MTYDDHNDCDEEIAKLKAENKMTSDSLIKPRTTPRGLYKAKAFPAGPLPAQAVYLIGALEVIDKTETRNGYVPGFHIAEQIGVSMGTMRPLLVKMSKAGITEGYRGPMGGYKRLRRATLREICMLVGHKYDLSDLTAWGRSVMSFHQRVKYIMDSYYV